MRLTRFFPFSLFTVLLTAAMSAAAADNDEPPCFAKVRKFLQAKPPQPGGADQELLKLLKTRHDTAVRRVQAYFKDYADGQKAVDALYPAFIKLHDSWIEQCDKPGDQLPAREVLLEVAKDIEKLAESRHEAGRIGDGELEEAHLLRQNAAIALLRVQRSAAKPK